jgi:hypothetical protein
MLPRSPDNDTVAPVAADDTDLTAQHLDVYDTRVGPWNPEHGEIEIPDEWDFLPSGDHFVTKQVTAAGTYWIAWKPRSRGRGHRRRLGLWAPADTIDAAKRKAAETEAARATARRSGARQRMRREDRFREELRAAIVAYLDFADEYADVATRIADAAARRAAEVGSGRVGRTGKLSLAEKAELAARAHIRHQHTDYEADLGSLPADELWADDEAAYYDARRAAHAAVDAFLAAHRDSTSGRS